MRDFSEHDAIDWARSCCESAGASYAHDRRTIALARRLIRGFIPKLVRAGPISWESWERAAWATARCAIRGDNGVATSVTVGSHADSLRRRLEGRALQMCAEHAERGGFPVAITFCSPAGDCTAVILEAFRDVADWREFVSAVRAETENGA